MDYLDKVLALRTLLAGAGARAPVGGGGGAPASRGVRRSRSSSSLRAGFLEQAQQVLGACPGDVLGSFHEAPGREDCLNLCVSARECFAGVRCGRLLLVYIALAGTLTLVARSASRLPAGVCTGLVLA